MAWIESHQSLRDHPKLLQLMEHLNVNKPQAVGHLHLLWWWCVDYAPQGAVRYNDGQIARAAEWSGEAKTFVEALIKSGFLDRSDGGLAVHDWPEFRLHYDAAIERKERQRDQVRDRVRRFRDKRNAPVTQCNAAKEPTEPTKPTEQTNGRRSDPVGASYDPGFSAFWDAYPFGPNKGSRHAAWPEWERLRPDDALRIRIMGALANHKHLPKWQEDDGEYIPAPARWLRERRWEIDVSDSLQLVAKSSGLPNQCAKCRVVHPWTEVCPK